MEKTYGLALEGGGAKGAYHVGVIKALKENGYNFNFVVGTSIGALNAAMVAQNKVDEMEDIWKNIQFSDLFDFSSNAAEKIAKNDFDLSTIKYTLKNLYKRYQEKGIETYKIKDIIEKNVDEDTLRSSEIGFGLMTFNVSDMKPAPTYIEDIPDGMLSTYILASANLPGFKKLVINEHSYKDGGLYDNLPINMLVKKGIKDIIAIKTGATARVQKVKNQDCNISYIVPTEKPGRLLDFTRESLDRAMKIGYHDGLKFVMKTNGNKYYLTDIENSILTLENFIRIDNIKLQELASIIGAKKRKSVIFSLTSLFSRLARLLDIPETDMEDLNKIVVALLEEMALMLDIDRLQVLKVEDLIKMVDARRLLFQQKLEKSSLTGRQVRLGKFYISLIDGLYKQLE